MMKAFESHLSELRQRVIDMGSLTQQMVTLAVKILSNPHDNDLVQQMFCWEEELDRMQVDIDRAAMQLMVLYCPVAADLRMVMSVSRLTVELERIGDQAVNLCKSAQLMPAGGESCLVDEIHELAAIVTQMVADSLDAFVRGDSEKARVTIQRDDEADRLNHQVVERLLSDRLSDEQRPPGSPVVDPLIQVLLARALERIGDQSTNICEEVVYEVKGEDIRHHHNGKDSSPQTSAE
jgi:phosphate transport system protein